MTSVVVKKNMFMNKHYGLFKSVVYRNIQLMYFIKHIRILIKTIEYTYNSSDKVSIVIEMLEYLSRTKDIWWLLNDKFSNVVKEKTLELASEIPDLQKYIDNFQNCV